MSKIYCLWATIPKKEFEQRIKYLIDNPESYTYIEKDQVYYGLYAWTTKKKKRMDPFFKLRNKIYTVKKIPSHTHADISRMRREYPTLELKRFKYFLDKEHRKDRMAIIVSTINEYRVVTEEHELYLDQLGLAFENILDYKVLKEKYQEALDKIGYTTIYETLYGDQDLAEFNRSFNLTVKGNKIISFDNQLNLLLYFYRFMFLGDDLRKRGGKPVIN